MDGALQDYNEAFRLKPTYAEPFHNRAISRSSKLDAKGAAQDYYEAIRLRSKPKR